MFALTSSGIWNPNGAVPRFFLAAVKDIVGGVMHKQRIQSPRLIGQDAWRIGVDRVGQSRFGLGAIDCSVGCGVQDHARLGASHQLADLPGIRQIDGFAIDREDRSVTGKGALQLQTDLSGSANNKNWLAFIHGEALRTAPSPFYSLTRDQKVAVPWRTMDFRIAVPPRCSLGQKNPIKRTIK